MDTLEHIGRRGDGVKEVRTVGVRASFGVQRVERGDFTESTKTVVAYRLEPLVGLPKIEVQKR